MTHLKLAFAFLLFSEVLFANTLSQTPLSSQPDVSSFPSEASIAIEPVIVNDPSVAFDEVDQAGMEHHSITAVDYANFLNSEAVTDPENLYDEKMGSDPKAACIIRCGSLGNFSYEVIASRENFAVPYFTLKSTDRFLRWLENNPLPAEDDVEQASEDDNFFLGSNWLGYCINSSFIAPTDALTENSSNIKKIFDYTPGATIGQRLLEYIFCLVGLGFGVHVAETILALLWKLTACLPEGISTIIIVLVGLACLFGCAYLGEKFGKWLGS